MAELKLEQLSKLFGDQAVVRDINLTIPQGAFTALLGPSGCGKTTTLRILAGLEQLSEGRLLLGDRLLADKITHTPPEQRDMGMVFQSYALWPHMTVAENVGYPLKLRKVKGAARLWGGATIAFVSALGNFGIPAMLGIPVSYFVLPIYIYQALSSFGPSMINEVAALSVLMGILAIAIVTLQARMQRRYALPLIGMAGRSLSFTLGRWRLGIEVLLGLVLFAILVAPLLALIATSLVPTMGVPLNSDTLTFAAWRSIFDAQSATWRALTNSMVLSVSSAMVLLVLSLPLAWLLVRYPSRPLRWLHSMIDIPYTLPGVVLAIACILLFARPLPILEISLSGTLTIIFIAYLARFLTVCLKPVHSSMMQLDPAMEEAASLAGANFSQRLNHIVLPLLAPAAFAGALLVFLTAVNELTVSALLWSAGKETLGVVIFSLDESGNKVLASAISVLVVALVAMVMLLLSALSKYLPKGVIPWQS